MQLPLRYCYVPFNGCTFCIINIDLKAVFRGGRLPFMISSRLVPDRLSTRLVTLPIGEWRTNTTVIQLHIQAPLKIHQISHTLYVIMNSHIFFWTPKKKVSFEFPGLSNEKLVINWCNLLNLRVLLVFGTPGEHVKWGHKHVHNL